MTAWSAPTSSRDWTFGGPAADHSTVLPGLEARIIAFLGPSHDHWAEVGRVTNSEWCGDLVTGLASALAKAADSTASVRYVYGLHEGGTLTG